MSTSRVSNKQILDSLNDLPGAIAAAMQGATVAAPAVAAAPVNEAPTGEANVKIDPKYLSHMSAKVNALTAADGNERILYTRRNGHGEIKLAYALASNWTGLKDKGLIGAVEICNGK